MGQWEDTGNNGWIITPEGLDVFREESDISPPQLSYEDTVKNFDKYMVSLMDSCFKKRKTFPKTHTSMMIG